MNRLKYIFIFFIFIPGLLQAQSLQGLQVNPEIKKHLAGQKPELKSAQSTTQLTLPFFEDFSTSSVFPDPAKWTDRYVFINNSFAINPISVGVATLDAIDQYGEVYAANRTAVSSDTLTSRDFDLSQYAGSGDPVRLSFFYQRGGRGEAPEQNDSLVVEFYNPVDNVWKRAWFAPMNFPVDTFVQARLVVPGSYYVNGFRFRFRNYTSLSASDVTGGEAAVGNADCWNIDYIMMDTDSDYEHSIIKNDITITDIPRRLLNFYETVPWLHLNSAVSITRNSVYYGIRNLMPEGGSSNIGRSYYVKYINDGTIQDFQPPWDEELPNGVLVFRDVPFFGKLTRNDDSNEGQIEVVSYLRTLDYGPKENDTSRVILHFKDTYAYDDGSPEYGFGIPGESTAGTLLAVRFRVFRVDTLKAVDIYFNRAYDHYNETLPFQLCIWKDGGGKPGDLLYMSEESYLPDFSSPEVDFIRYPILADDPILVTDTVVYVGLKQLTNESLNLGYDVNRDNRSRTFVNMSGQWFNPGESVKPGTVMIRAAFGSKGVTVGSGNTPDIEPELTLYPNPVSQILNINSGTDIKKIVFIDISGRIVMQQRGDLRMIDVSSLSPGIYQVMVCTGAGSPFVRKVVISR